MRQGRGLLQVIRLLNLRHLRQRPLRAAISVLSIGAGVSLAVTGFVVQSSLAKAAEGYARSLSGPAPLRVVGPSVRGGLDESVPSRVDAVHGVRAAVPAINAVTLAESGNGREIPIVALGFDCRIESVIGRVCCSPESLAAASVDAPPLVSPSLARRLGPDGIVRTDLGPRPARNALPVKAMDGVNAGRAVAYPLHVAQELFARPQSLDAIYVFPDTDTDVQDLQRRLQQAVGAHNSVLDADTVLPWLAALGDFVAIFGLIALFSLGTGAVLAYNSIALSLADRRRHLAIASALGANPRLLSAGALTEAALLGLVGGLVGAGLGIAVAHPIANSIEQAFTLRLGSLEVPVHAGPASFVLGAVLGIIVALVASLRAIRRAGRVDVVAEISNRATETEGAPARSARRALTFTALGLAGLSMTYLASRDGGLEPWQPVAGQLALVATMVFFLLAAGQFAPLVLRGLAPYTSRLNVSARLGWSNVTRQGLRTASMVVAMGAAVGIAFALSSFTRIMVTTFVEDEVLDTQDRVAVTTLPLSNTLPVDAKPSPEMVQALRRMPGVARVDRTLAVGVATSTEQFFGAGADDQPTFPFDVLEGTADPERFRRGEVLIGPTLARRWDVAPGDVVDVPGRKGIARVTVQGIWANGDFNGAEMTMPVWLIEKLWGPQPPQSLTITPRPGADPAELARRIEDAGLDPHVEALALEERIEDARRTGNLLAATFWVVQRALLLLAFAAVLFNFLLVAAQRRRELGLVAAVGMTPRGLGLMVLTEAVAVGLVATVLGSAFGLGVLEAFRQAFYFALPYRTRLEIDPFAPLVYGAIAIVVAVAAAALPAWRAARLQVVDAIRYE